MNLKLSLKSFGFLLGVVLFIIILSLPTFSPFEEIAKILVPASAAHITPSELASSIQSVCALFILMVIWWITEAIPLPITSLLPAVLLPFLHVKGMLHGAVYEFTIKNVLLSYANPVIYLFLGGFLIAAAMQKWKLDQRLTLWILTRGTLADNSRTVLLGMMVVTAFLSMWISNTATTAMMLPIGLGILHLMKVKPGESRYATSLMLGIAWSASIGGIGTIIGTPPNGITLGILNSMFANDPSYHRITFFDWMKFGVPYVVIMIPIVWIILLRLNPPEIKSLPGGKEQLMRERSLLGKMNRGEKLTIAAFLLAVVLWMTNPFWPALLPDTIAAKVSWVDEYSIGLFVGALCFLLPVNFKESEFLLTWSDTKFVDWGTLILFGGGIALSDAMFKSGLATWISTAFVSVFGTPSILLLMAAIILLVNFLTEVTSNTAVTGMIVPIVISIAQTMGENPVTLAVAAAVAASLAFMLPVATPPNALVYGTGYVSLKQMVRNGFIFNIIGWVLTVCILYFVAGKLFGILEF
jgi:solute carrier family 13 (sodium-dependent dicarboxylate transporter), member 2/3/5